MIVVAPGVPNGSEETLTVGATAVGITSSLFLSGSVARKALCQVLDASVYASFHSQTATPDSGDFLLEAGTILYIEPANMVRFIRVTSSARVKVQVIE